MKRRLVFGGLLALVAALVCLWAFRPAAPKADDDSAKSDAGAPTYTFIYERPESDFERMEISGAGFEPYAVRSDLFFGEDGALLGVGNSLAQPILLEGDEAFRFNSYAYQMLLLVARGLPSVGETDASASDEALGLNKPTAVCRVHYKGGDTLTVSVGSLTPTGDNCYVAVQGDARRYLVPADLHATLSKGVNALHYLPASLGFSPSQVTRLRLERADGDAAMIEKKQDEAAIIPYRMTSPITHDIDADTLTEALASLCAALPERYVGRADDEQALAKYGLLNPALRLTLVIDEKYMALIAVGIDAENGMTYCTLDTTGDVYAVDKAKLGFANMLTSENLLDRYIALLPVTELSELSAEAGGAARVLAPVWSGKQATPYADKYTADGKEISREEFTRLYQSAISLMFDKLYTGEAVDLTGRAPKLALAFTKRDGTRTAIGYYSYDDFYNIAEIDGEARFLLRSRKVDRLIEALFYQ